MKKILYVLVICFTSCVFMGCDEDGTISDRADSDATNEHTISDNDTGKVNTVNIIIGDKKFVAELQDNETAKEFIKLLPMTVNMQELNGNEKYVYLDKNLPTAFYNPCTINSGDIMLYGNNCLVIFYKTFSSSYSYTKIGHIKEVGPLEDALGKENVIVKWE
ncbi:MAG: hypothetical protein IJ681_07265 [Bacteroidales bacterium]|nr:hypothetical protein [Bacteroidales bacterium]